MLCGIERESARPGVSPGTRLFAMRFGMISNCTPTLAVRALYVRPKFTCTSEPMRVRISEFDSAVLVPKS